MLALKTRTATHLAVLNTWSLIVHIRAGAQKYLCILNKAITVKLRYNNLRYNNIPRYNNIFSVDQKQYLLINAIRYNNMIRYNNTWGADQTYCYSGALLYITLR